MAPRKRDDHGQSATTERYRRPLERYARSLLGRHHDAEDVVQDVLVKAHAELAAGRGPADLRPWLYRLTRNRAIDEMRRARWGDASLDAAYGAADRGEADDGLAHPPAAPDDDPVAVIHRRESMRALAQDLADLPVAQRSALLSRVVDGDSPQESAARLGVSVEAVQMLVVRARANLMEMRALRRAKGDLETQLMMLAPPGGLLGAFGVAKLVGFGGGKVVAVLSAAAVAVTAAGGFVISKTFHATPGQPSPFNLIDASSVIGQHVVRGQTLPDGTAVMSATATIGAGAPSQLGKRVVALTCPAGMRFAQLIDIKGNDDQDYLAFQEVGGMTSASGGRTVTYRFSDRPLAAPRSIQVRALCRAPGKGGSLLANPRLPHPDEGRGEICHVGYVYRGPEHLMIGTVFVHQKVAITRKASRSVYAVTDTHLKGWVKIAALCRGWTLAKKYR